MSLLNVFEFVFPVVGGHYDVVGGHYDKNKDFIVKNIFGTCLSISNDIFLTAGHVIKEIEEENLSLSIGKIANKEALHYSVLTYEILSDFDLAIIRTGSKLSDVNQFKWELTELAMLDEVRTVGFPHALDFSRGEIYIRSFMGYVVSTSEFYRLESSPRSYELSFIAPKGLSGAPLFSSSKIFPPLKGYVIGNSHIKIPILREAEKEADEDVTRIIESYEWSTFGVAIQVGSITNIESEILNGSLFKFLEKNNLMLDPSISKIIR